MTLKKTNAARLLDSFGLPYSLHYAEYDENDLSALALAHSMGIPPAQIYKTLVVRGNSPDGSCVVMACIPGPDELDLKKLATAAGLKNAALTPLKEVLQLTGYQRGGCSPLAAKKQYPIFLDESAVLWDKIFVSAGLRGHQLLLAPDVLIRAANLAANNEQAAIYADLCRSDLRHS